MDLIGQTWTNQNDSTWSTTQSRAAGTTTSSNRNLAHSSPIPRPITWVRLRNLLPRDGKCRLAARRSRNHHFGTHLTTTLTPAKTRPLDTRPRPPPRRQHDSTNHITKETELFHLIVHASEATQTRGGLKLLLPLLLTLLLLRSLLLISPPLLLLMVLMALLMTLLLLLLLQPLLLLQFPPFPPRYMAQCLFAQSLTHFLTHSFTRALVCLHATPLTYSLTQNHHTTST